MMDAVCGRFIVDSLVYDAESKTGVFTKLRVKSECTIMLGGPMYRVYIEGRL